MHEAKVRQTKKRSRQIHMYMGDINNPLLVFDKTRRPKISNDIEALNNTVKQLDLNNIYRTLHSTIAEYMLFSRTCSTFTRSVTC